MRSLSKQCAHDRRRYLMAGVVFLLAVPAQHGSQQPADTADHRERETEVWRKRNFIDQRVPSEERYWGRFESRIGDRVITPIDADFVALLGEGIDLVSNTPTRSVCIEVGPPTRTKLGTQQSSFTEMTDESSLLERLGYSSNARLKVAGIGGSSRVDLNIETRISSLKTTALLSATRSEFVLSVGPPVPSGDRATQTSVSLHGWARRLLASDPRAFRRKCGDGYVVQQVWGSTFAAVFDFSHATFESRKSLSAQLDVSIPGDLFGGGLKGSLYSEVNKSDRKTRLQLLIDGAGTQSLPTDLAGLFQLYSSLPSTGKDNERPVRSTIVPYTAVLPDTSFGRDHRNLLALIRHDERLRTVLRDVDDAIAFQDANDYIRLERLDPVRTTRGLQETRESLVVLRGLLAQRVSKCRAKQLSSRTRLAEECKYPSNLVKQHVADELHMRIRAPLAVTTVSEQELRGWVATNSQLDGGPIEQGTRCEIAKHIALVSVVRPMALRCRRDDDCIPSLAIRAAELEARKLVNCG